MLFTLDKTLHELSYAFEKKDFFVFAFSKTFLEEIGFYGYYLFSCSFLASIDYCLLLC